jgi:hypothetical protein
MENHSFIFRFVPKFTSREEHINLGPCHVKRDLVYEL